MECITICTQYPDESRRIAGVVVSAIIFACLLTPVFVTFWKTRGQ